ncbi:MAG: Unknown protein [uncultured Campylobacterales bacterium]|uniref:AMP-dependent synthetase/ligase domain-containing protein n=1 Tax=uncultured Campylobacterales bacterium TaxID=352960 RepID=A0A6S6SXV6_9BACT|nr:MAG: Unknown protein [uncultured Campylobacterales bacterium]
MNSLYSLIKNNHKSSFGDLSYYEKDALYSVSRDEFWEDVGIIATALHIEGIGKGDTVAIVSEPSVYWMMMDMAILSLGAISVPMFSNISEANLEFQMKDADIKYMFVQDGWDKVSKYARDMNLVITKGIDTSLRNSVRYEDFINIKPKNINTHIDDDDIATIIYTSGSTGMPKGVELTHKNLITQVLDISEILNLKAQDKALSFLPLAHVFERTVMNFYMYSGVHIYLINDIDSIGKRIKEINPTIMTTVPRLLEKIYDKINIGIKEKGAVSKTIASICIKRARSKNPNTKNSFIDGICKKLLYTKLQKIFGTDMKYIVSGGAKLRDDLHKFYLNAQLPLYQGYGLSEHSPVVCTNYPKNNRYPSCGKPLKSVEVKLSDKNELLVKSPSVMKGYHNMDNIIKDGWLGTGDIASIDKDGYITIVSRLKDLCKTSTGKYINSAYLELELAKSDYIEYVHLIAENKKFVSAIIFSEENPEKIQSAVDNLNKTLDQSSKIKKIYISKKLPTVENTMLTPSMKIAKKIVEDVYTKEIEKMYTK